MADSEPGGVRSEERGGIPNGARTTPVADVLFSRELPALAEPVAIKVLLHAVWRIHRRPVGSDPGLRHEDLVADPTLRRGVAVLGVSEAEIVRRIDGAVALLERRSILLAVGRPGADHAERWLFINDPLGRRTLDRLRAGGDLLSEAPRAPSEAVSDAEADTDGERSGDRPNIFVRYEEQIGMLSPMIAEELTEAAETYPADWIEDAFERAAAANVRRWAYVRAILERWAREGRETDDATDRGRAEAGDRQRERDAWDDWIRR